MTIVMLTIAIAVALLFLTVFTLGGQLLSDYRKRFTEDAHFNLRELYLVADPTKLYLLNISIVLLIALAVWLFTESSVLTLLTSIGLAFLPWMIFNFLKKRRLDQVEQQLPDALLLISGSVKAGLSLSSAIRQVSTEFPQPLVQEFRLMMHEQRLGVTFDDSLESLAHRLPVQSIHLMVSAMRIANETGGGLAETLERAAATLRSQHAMERKIRALTAQGKLQAWVVGLLPVLLLYVLTKMEPAAMSMLWTTHIGYGVIAVVVMLEFFGVMLIRKIVAIDV